MKKIFHEASAKSGVYRILNIKNGRVYYGSTGCFYKRAQAHINDLIYNRHSNTYLLNDFNKCSPDAFIFEVVEVIEGTSTDWLAAEQLFIDKHFDNQKQCYNITPNARETRQGKKQKKKGNPLTDKRFRSPSDEVIKKRAQAIREAKKTPEQKEKAKQHAKNLWKDHKADITLVHMETGEEVYVDKPLKTFAEERGLSYKSLHLLTKGKTKSCGGWFVKGHKPVYVSQKGQVRKPLGNTHKQKIAASIKGIKYDGVKIISPEGDMLDLPINIKRFCKENIIHYSTFLKMINRQCKTCNGWKALF
jgi:group I intron endonuclease